MSTAVLFFVSACRLQAGQPVTVRLQLENVRDWVSCYVVSAFPALWLCFFMWYFQISKKARTDASRSPDSELMKHYSSHILLVIKFLRANQVQQVDLHHLLGGDTELYAFYHNGCLRL